MVRGGGGGGGESDINHNKDLSCTQTQQTPQLGTSAPNGFVVPHSANPLPPERSFSAGKTRGSKEVVLKEFGPKNHNRYRL